MRQWLRYFDIRLDHLSRGKVLSDMFAPFELLWVTRGNWFVGDLTGGELWYTPITHYEGMHLIERNHYKPSEHHKSQLNKKKKVLVALDVVTPATGLKKRRLHSE